jgi:hypothetical protein
VLKLDPGNRYALSNLEKLYEDQHQWDAAYAIAAAARPRCPSAVGRRARLASARTRSSAFLENEFGQAALRGGNYRRSGAAASRPPSSATGATRRRT